MRCAVSFSSTSFIGAMHSTAAVRSLFLREARSKFPDPPLPLVFLYVPTFLSFFFSFLLGFPACFCVFVSPSSYRYTQVHSHKEWIHTDGGLTLKTQHNTPYTKHMHRSWTHIAQRIAPTPPPIIPCTPNLFLTI